MTAKAPADRFSLLRGVRERAFRYPSLRVARIAFQACASKRSTIVRCSGHHRALRGTSGRLRGAVPLGPNIVQRFGEPVHADYVSEIAAAAAESLGAIDLPRKWALTQPRNLR